MFLFFVLCEEKEMCAAFCMSTFLIQHWTLVWNVVFGMLSARPRSMTEPLLCFTHGCRRSLFYLYPHLLVHRALDHPSVRPVAQFLCNLVKLSFFLTQEQLRVSLRPTDSISLSDVLLGVSPVCEGRDFRILFISTRTRLNIKIRQWENSSLKDLQKSKI